MRLRLPFQVRKYATLAAGMLHSGCLYHTPSMGTPLLGRICNHDINDAGSIPPNVRKSKALLGGRRSSSRTEGRGSTSSGDTISRWRKARLDSAQSLSRPQLDEYPPLYFMLSSPTLILHCILLLPFCRRRLCSTLCVVNLFHLTGLSASAKPVPTATKDHHAPMHRHAGSTSGLVQ
jgi:hypothetical protein